MQEAIQKLVSPCRWRWRWEFRRASWGEPHPRDRNGAERRDRPIKVADLVVPPARAVL